MAVIHSTILASILALLLTLSLALFAGPSTAAEETLILADGVPLKILFFEPGLNAQANSTVDSTANSTAPPLALLLAGGTSNEFMARAQFWFGREFVERGWAIAVPISPDGKRFSSENIDVLPQLIEFLHQSHQLRDGKPLLVGISSGGSAALEIASNKPEYFSGVVATPGRLVEGSTTASLQGLPIYLRIGEKDDFRWNRSLEAMAEQLSAAGAQVNASLVPGAKHIFSLDWDGLEKWLEQTR